MRKLKPRVDWEDLMSYSRDAVDRNVASSDSDEAFRLARLIALIVRANPATAGYANRMIQVELTDANGRAFGLHVMGGFINFTDYPSRHYRRPDLIIATTCLTWAELCVGAVTLREAVQKDGLVIKHGTIDEAEDAFNLLHKLRLDTPVNC
jgi:hypothetical protein